MVEYKGIRQAARARKGGSHVLSSRRLHLPRLTNILPALVIERGGTSRSTWRHICVILAEVANDAENNGPVAPASV